MKTLVIKVSEELHKKIKIYAAQNGKTVTEIVTELVKEKITKKEQTQ